MDFIRRGAAIICKRGQKGIDLMIPIVLTDGNLSFVLVQVKNRKSDPERKTAHELLTPESVGLANYQAVPYLAIWCSVGLRTCSYEDIQSIHLTDPNQFGFSVTGFKKSSYPVIPANCEKILDEIRVCHRDVRTVSTDEAVKAYVQN